MPDIPVNPVLRLFCIHILTHQEEASSRLVANYFASRQYRSYIPEHAEVNAHNLDIIHLRISLLNSCVLRQPELCPSFEDTFSVVTVLLNHL